MLPGVRPLPLKSGVVSLVRLSELERPESVAEVRSAGVVGVAGGVLSTVRESGADTAPLMPAILVYCVVIA